MNIEYTPGKVHPNITTKGNSMREINRLPIKLKLLTSTYILQSNRAAFNQNTVNPVCQLCNRESEDIEHFLFNCEILEPQRKLVLCEIKEEYTILTGENYNDLSSKQQIGIILDCTNIPGIKPENLHKLEYHCRRLTYLLHSARYKSLLLLKPKRIRNSGRAINTVVQQT
jgi:hypothetical protein